MKVRNYVIGGILAFAICLSYSTITAKANQTASSLKSNGRIVHDNHTPGETADDVVIFDAEDLQRIERSMKELEARITAAKTKFN